jgi:hypothetical protein
VLLELRRAWRIAVVRRPSSSLPAPPPSPAACLAMSVIATGTDTAVASGLHCRRHRQKQPSWLVLWLDRATI